MSTDAIASVQAAADAAALRLSVALAHDRPGPHASPADIERGHAEVAAARADLARADAAVQAAEAVTTPPPVALVV
jgi:hypothetical protein